MEPIASSISRVVRSCRTARSRARLDIIVCRGSSDPANRDAHGPGTLEDGKKRVRSRLSSGNSRSIAARSSDDVDVGWFSCSRGSEIQALIGLAYRRLAAVPVHPATEGDERRCCLRAPCPPSARPADGEAQGRSASLSQSSCLLGAQRLPVCRALTMVGGGSLS